MPVNNLAAWKKAITKAAKKLPAEVLPLFLKRITLDLNNRLTENTPVDTGHAKRNWQVTQGEPALDIIPGGALGEQHLATVEATLRLRPFVMIWISNNVSYVVYLDAGSSKRNNNAGIINPALEAVSVSFE